MTVRAALEAAVAHISKRDAETLLAAVLDCDRAWLLAHPEALLSEEKAGRFKALTARRAAHEPLQYLTGTQEFFGLRLRVTPTTLIPRPETEHLVEAVLSWCARHSVVSPRVVDVGTGTGAIALALAKHFASAAIIACDLSAEALAVARHNAEELGLLSRLTLLHSDLLAAVPSFVKFDVVVSNPPYVPRGDADTMQPEVVRHEPHLALFAGDDGLDIYRRLIPQAHAALREGGLLALEIGFGQRDSLAALLAEGWRGVRFVDDYAGIPRVVLAERVTTGDTPLR